MRALRIYRLIPALLSLSLVLTAATPLVRHACPMADMETMTKSCCKGKADRHDMPHGDRSGAMPCHDTPTSDAPEAPCSDSLGGLGLQAACCTNVEAPAAPVPERVEVLPASLVTLVATVLAPPAEPPSWPPRLPGDLPPPAPVALHLLYGSFLT